MLLAEMSRTRIAATESVNQLTTRINAAQGSAREALKTQRTKAARLEAAASVKEVAAALSSDDPNAGTKLSSAADALEAEVERLEQSAARLTQLGNALTAAKRVVDSINIVT